ncbi:TIGR03083 family protein [Modestobacter sp. DSM 44400]|uniref:maleylpyruvate isomerase family mycothiol-dependent enzyme n=1 Tax=Modestobacter sp. DSM 44400 TaxID=1550230 RepID=UPI00089D0153|nr:maleylpyruvate isomerase family mycothiol-dependent enzyme [Modestobacter sp. DSM 44400]SDY51555.1 TIGR03083 family protein [Modestobacter sp. DSM 44400]
MSGTVDDVDVRVREERARLVSVLEALDDEQWQTPSLCAGWSVRDLVVHLLMPYELPVHRFALLMLRARMNFDRAADRWATTDRRSPSEVMAALRDTEHQTFSGGPGAPAEAPLSHLVIHAEDVYWPLGVPSPTDPEDAGRTLDQLTSPRGRRALTPGLLDGLAFSASDTSWSSGDGAQVSGPAVALVTTIAGRTAALHELTGDGVAPLRARLQPVT